MPLAVALPSLSDIGNFLLGVGTVAAAVGAWVSATRSRAAKDHANEAKKSAQSAERTTAGNRVIADKIASSVGDANGDTMKDLLHKIVGFEEYQHERNHDLLNRLTLVTGGIPLLLDQSRLQTDVLQQILDRLPPPDHSPTV